MNSSRLNGVETLADIKGLGIGESSGYASFRAEESAGTTRVGGDSDPNFENYDLFHAQSPNTGCGVHARSWRVNRDVDVRC